MGKAKPHRYKPSIAEYWQQRRKVADRCIAKFAGSSMSTTKWRKAFCILVDPTLGISLLRWKFVFGDQLAETGPVHEPVEGGDVHQTLYTYSHREIEWVEFVTPDPRPAIAALRRAGKFDVEVVPQGFRIYGYR